MCGNQTVAKFKGDVEAYKVNRELLSLQSPFADSVPVESHRQQHQGQALAASGFNVASVPSIVVETCYAALPYTRSILSMTVNLQWCFPLNTIGPRMLLKSHDSDQNELRD